MSRVFAFIWSLFVCCGLWAQQYHFQVEVRRPAAIDLSAYLDNSQSLLLVNNALTQPDDFGHRNKRNDIDLPADTISLADAPRRCLFGLESGLFDAALFDEVSLVEKTVNTSTNFYLRNPLKSSAIDSLLDRYQSDVILALNQLVVFDMKESFLTDEDTYYAYLEAYCSAHWTVCPRGGKPYYFFTKDTLIWTAQEAYEQEAINSLPDRQTALLDFVDYVGKRLSERIFPQWEQQDRYLYYGDDKAFQPALDAFARQKWGEAGQLWCAIANNSQLDPLQRAYAAADVAIALEMQEDFQQAVAWTDTAIAFLSKVHTAGALQQAVNLRYYRELLLKRIDTK